MSTEIPYDVLIKYCRNQASKEENLQIEQWLLEDDNFSTFLELKKEWEHIDDSSTVMPNKELLWRKIKLNTYAPKGNTHKTFSMSKWLLAASVMLILAVSTFLYIQLSETRISQQNFYATLSTKENEKLKVELSDGTQVWLNANSTLLYSDDYNMTTREVKAEGELFFDVAKSSKKFIINIGKVRVEVLGTAFNIRTTGIDENIEIALKRGRVAVVNAETNKQLLVMDSSQHVSIQKSTLDFVLKNENTAQCDTWTSDNLMLYNESLSNIIPKLESWYDIKIHCEGLDTTKRYSFNIQDENLNDFLDLFSAITPINYSISGKNVSIQPDNSN